MAVVIVTAVAGIFQFTVITIMETIVSDITYNNTMVTELSQAQATSLITSFITGPTRSLA